MNTLPRVTILTPTTGSRDAFLRQCSKYVDRQTYPAHLLEWLIIDAGTEEAVQEPQHLFPPFENKISVVRYFRHGSVGMLRNHGVRLAKGEIIVHFDDDDWQAHDRVERQVAPFLRSSHLDLVCTDDYYIGLFNEAPVRAMKSPGWNYEICSSGGSFAYRREAALRSPFMNMPTGEDYLFAKYLRMKGYASRVQNLHDASLFIAIRHGKNTCPIDGLVTSAANTETADWVLSMMGVNDFNRIVELSS